MMVCELLDTLDLQGEVKYCYYDWEKNQRIDAGYDKLKFKEIRYIYSENNIIYIEADIEE